MARTRSLKPGFFKNELLVELPFEARLLFSGLWTLADREGRLEDRPLKIKMEIFPCDDLDIDVLLSLLAEKHFITRYAVESNGYIQINKFTEHQHPHPKEPKSVIPEPCNATDSNVKSVASLVKGETTVNRKEEEWEDPEMGKGFGEGVTEKHKKTAAEFQAEIFVVTESMRNWAKENVPGVDIDLQTLQFVDHHSAKGSKFKDWIAAWRTWMRNAVGFSPRGTGKQVEVEKVPWAGAI